MPPVLRYVPKARCKEGETPISGSVSENTGGKAIKKDSGANLSTLKECVTLPTRNMYQSKVSRPSPLEFVSCSKILLDGDENLPNARTKEGFDPNAYKLMEKVGYDFNNPVALGRQWRWKPMASTKRKGRFKNNEV